MEIERQQLQVVFRSVADYTLLIRVPASSEGIMQFAYTIGASTQCDSGSALLEQRYQTIGKAAVLVLRILTAERNGAVMNAVSATKWADQVS